MKIVIAGLSRSGTSALFFKIKNSLSAGSKCLFEPNEYRPSGEDNERTVLSKILLNGDYLKTDYESFNCFDKKILIVRDPRDRLISTLLYMIYPSFYRDEERSRRIMSLLKKKENNSKSVSVSDILTIVKKFGWHDFLWKLLTSPKPHKLKKYLKNINFWSEYTYGKYFNFAMEFHDQHKDYFVIKYEDFIYGKLEELENYLGFKLSGEAVLDKSLHTVKRKGKSGVWKNWFLKRDIDFFMPFFIPFMKKYDYANDWTPNVEPEIDPRYASFYVRKIIEGQKLGNNKGPQTKVFNT